MAIYKGFLETKEYDRQIKRLSVLEICGSQA